MIISKVVVQDRFEDRSPQAMMYLPEGVEGAPGLVMCHGYNGCAADFDADARYLAQSGIAVICPTFCGGSTRDESGYPSTKMTLFTELHEVNVFLDLLKKQPCVDPDKVFLFGGSMGGMVSVLQGKHEPEQIAGLILLFPALCIPANWEERFPRVEEIPETVAFWDLTLGRDFFTSMRGLDPFAGMQYFDKPVLILQGDVDPIVPLADSQRAAALYPRAELQVFPGEGHGFTPAGCSRVRQLTLAFIRQHTTR